MKKKKHKYKYTLEQELYFLNNEAGASWSQEGMSCEQLNKFNSEISQATNRLYNVLKEHNLLNSKD